MNNVLEAIKYAREYLANDITYPPTEDGYRLHRQLQYQLHGAAGRLIEKFGEVTRKDVALVCEAWIVSQGTRRPHKPLQPHGGVGEDH